MIVVATHIHYDHVGSFHEFGTRLMHGLEAPRMAPYREFCTLTTNEMPSEFLADLAAMDMPVEGEALLDALPDSEIGAYVATMRRLRELPVDVVHGGHDESFGRARLVEIADGYIERRELT